MNESNIIWLHIENMSYPDDYDPDFRKVSNRREGSMFPRFCREHLRYSGKSECGVCRMEKLRPPRYCEHALEWVSGARQSDNDRKQDGLESMASNLAAAGRVPRHEAELMQTFEETVGDRLNSQTISIIFYFTLPEWYRYSYI